MSAPPDGVLVVDKPEGMTSHDIVAAVRRRLPRGTKVGHTGTLDPFATGVLPVVIGKATRLSQFLTASRKRYRACVTFGTATDSGDRMGAPIQTADPRALDALAAPAVERALATLVGTHLQVPPAHSAKKVDGERAYTLARRGDAVDLPAVEVTAHALSLVAWDGTLKAATLDLEVSAGYYVRSLARDLGTRLVVPAHLTALRRTGSGEWCLENAHPLAEVLQAIPEDFAALRLPMSTLLRSWPAITLDARQVQAALAGRLVELHLGQAADVTLEQGARARLLDEAGELVALALPTTSGHAVHADIVLR